MSYARRHFRVAPSALVWVLGGLGLALTAVSVPLASPVPQLALNNVVTEAVIVLAYGLAGALIARRQPRNPIGWIMLIFVVHCRSWPIRCSAGGAPRASVASS